MNGKSKTKKLLTSSKPKFQVENNYRKHKSQESYSDLKTISSQIPIQSSKSKQNLSPKNINKITNVKIKNIMNMININTNNLNNNINITNTSPISNLFSLNIFNNKISNHKSDKKKKIENIFNKDSVKILDTEENDYDDTEENDNREKTSKIKRNILNDFNKDQQNNKEENEKIKKYNIIKDSSTNSIGEVSTSFVGKGEGIINNLPNTFVRQSENKLIVQKPSKPLMDVNFHIKNFNSKNTLNEINNTEKLEDLNSGVKENKNQNLISNKNNDQDDTQISVSQSTCFENFKSEKNKLTNIKLTCSNSNANFNSNFNYTKYIENSNPSLKKFTIPIKVKKKSANNLIIVNNSEIKINNNNNNTNYNTKYFNLDQLKNENFTSRDTENKKIEKIEKEEKLSTKLYIKLLLAAKKGDREAFLEILSQIYKIEGNNTNISFKDDSGWSAIHYASDEGNLKIVEILMKMNVESNLKTATKKTALHLSAEKGYFDISKILIENGALLTLLDDEKNTPIHLCAYKGHYELMKYFLEKIPQADGKNIYGKTPWDLAMNEKIKDLIYDYLNKKSYNYHKITIHTANNKVVNDFLNNIKDKKSNYETADNCGEKKLVQNNTNPMTTAYSKNNKNKVNILRDNTVYNIEKNDINSNLKFQTDKTIMPINKILDKNKDQVSSGSGSSIKENSKHDLSVTYNYNTSFENFKSKTLKSGENNSDDYNNSSNIDQVSSNDEEKIGPSSFVCHALLGKGSFGEVYLVEKKDSKIFYAMKVLSKDKIMGIKKVFNLIFSYIDYFIFFYYLYLFTYYLFYIIKQHRIL